MDSSSGAINSPAREKYPYKLAVFRGIAACNVGETAYVQGMDWQQSAALTIVGITALSFAASWWRSRNQPRHAKVCCGGASRRNSPQGRIIYRARKGHRPEIIVKMP
jgi:hypothetical protein